MHRPPYPSAEIAINKANMDETISRMGPDNPDTKVWWVVDLLNWKLRMLILLRTTLIQ